MHMKCFSAAYVLTSQHFILKTDTAFPFPLGFNDNIYHEWNISKMPDFDAFFLLDVKNVINDPMVSAKMAILNENIKLFYLFLI